MTFDADAFLAERDSARAEVGIVTKTRLRDEIDRLRAEFKRVKDLDEAENRIPEAPQILEQIEELRQEMEASTRRFVFEEIPGHLFEKLVRECPPRKQDKEAGSAWNSDEFPPLLMAAAAVDPQMSREAAKKLWKGLPQGERLRMWNVVFGVQSQVASVPLAVSGIGSTRTTATRSDTAAPEESREASS